MQSHFFRLYFLSTLKMEIMSQELKTIDFPTDFGSLNGMERKTKRKKTVCCPFSREKLFVSRSGTRSIKAWNFQFP